MITIRDSETGLAIGGHQHLGDSTRYICKPYPDQTLPMYMFVIFLLCSTAEDVLDSSRPQSLSAYLEAGESIRRPRLPSFFIRQMSESKLLIKSEQIKLLDSVGQGEYISSLQYCF